MTLSSHFIVIIAEVLFILLVAALLRLAFVAKKVRAMKRQIQAQVDLIQRLTESLAKAQNALTPAAGEGGEDLDDLATRLREAEQMLLTYKQRVDNLERFRKLYFALDQRLSDEVAEMEAKDRQLAEFLQLIESQEHLVEGLRSSIHELAEKYSFEAAVREDMEETIDKLEENTEVLRFQLNRSEKQLLKAEMLNKELDHYKHRVQHLEDVERRLLQEAERYRRELQQSGLEEKPLASPYGRVKLVEIEHMSVQLEKKEEEIRHLRQECETVARQYEALAVTSMKSVNASAQSLYEEQVNLQQLQFILEQSAQALAKKQAECEHLENLYLQLKNEESVHAADRMENSFAECKALEAQVRELAEKAEQFGSDTCSIELAALRKTLNEKEAALQKVRRSYQQLKQQFVVVSHEDISLKERCQQLQQERDELSAQLQVIRQKADRADTLEVEVTDLRGELTRLEEKYLKLVGG